MRVLLFILLLIPLSLAAAPASTEIPAAPLPLLNVHYPASNDPTDTRSGYFITLLSLALEETQADFGSYEMTPVFGLTSQERIISQLSKGLDVDVMWTMTSKEREQVLLPVRIPLLKGLMGYRLLIIRKAEQERFAHINTLAQLERLTAGQGHDWPDTRILASNGITVVTSTDYDALFKMLDAGRFDFMPRAVNEPFDELAQRPTLPLMVEPHLALLYPTAEYFFVNKHNAALAKRLHEGLTRAIKDGRFDELFQHYPANVDAFARAHLGQRTLIRLKNPLLPKDTPLDDASLWFYPASP